ncbi:sugar phosphate isomerase/epimerase [Arthrobacter sp. Br18]|uniref:sugar phosphate isomerase/epimerase family protein n=1 Tax=Arthrobacter sp. Br18 TaxID=1312954 RepID=UPI00047988A2|nr:sugar phosphate isomerase/epimerase [Arthrobacter sp. Br18]
MPNRTSLSVQLYSVRDAIKADLDTAIDRIAAIGFTSVEPYGFTSRAAELASALGRNGLSAPSGHASLLSSEQAPIFEAARTLGMATVIDPFVDPARWTTEDDIKVTADALNSAADAASSYDLRVGYHNHWFEVETDFGGRTGLEVLGSHLSPEVVLEVDTYWVAVGGQSPADLLRKLGDRVKLIHVKDGDVSRDNRAQVAVGSGRMDIPAVLAAAAAVETFVVELDDSSGNLFTALEDSYTYLTRYDA